MSLVVQLSRDLDIDRGGLDLDTMVESRNKSLSDSEFQNDAENFATELPLFAAAAAIQRQKERQQIYRRAAMLIVVIASILLVYFQYIKNDSSDTPISLGAIESTLVAQQKGASQTQGIEIATTSSNGSIGDSSFGRSELAASPIDTSIAIQPLAIQDRKKSASEVNEVPIGAEENSNSVMDPNVESTYGLGDKSTVVEQFSAVSEIASSSEAATVTADTAVGINVAETEADKDPAVLVINPVKQSRPLSTATIDRHLAERAERLIQSESQAEAISLLESQHEQYRGEQKSLPKSALLLSSLLLDNGQLEQAQDLVVEYRKTASKYPVEINRSFAKLDIRLAIMQERFDHALFVIGQNAVPVNQDHDFLAFQAAIFQAQKNYSAASTAYQSLLTFDRYHASWWMGLAVSLDALASSADAKQAYQQALDLGGLDYHLDQYARTRLAKL